MIDINIQGWLKNKIETKANKTLDNVTAAAADNLNAVGARTCVEAWSDGTSFYYKFSDGFKICGGGPYGSLGINVGRTIYFPLTFTQTPKIATGYGVPDLLNMNWKAAITDLTKTYFTFQLYSLAGNAVISNFGYLAEGY